MNKTFSSLFFLFISNIFIGQNLIDSSVVFNTHKITFYGYDFSKFHLTDAKRGGQDIKMHIYKLIGELIEDIPEEKHKKWFKIDTVKYDFEPTALLNQKIDGYEAIVPTFVSLKRDSLQNFINKYPIPKTSGIGYTIIVECFDDIKESISVYGILFDITTRKILLINYAALHDIGRINRFPSWKEYMIETTQMLTEIYNDKKTKFLKKK
jgi:hypothetical protein